MPRSVYWPLRHMSHSPDAQAGQGTGSGRRTMPTTRSPGAKPLDGGASITSPNDSWPSTRRSFAGRRVAVVARDDLAVGAAHAERQRAHQDRAVVERRLGDVVEPR